MRIFAQGQHNGTTPYFFTRDHLGSVREVLSGGGTVVARYDYDPYGRSTTILGTTPTDMNFTGLYRHAKSNLDLAVYRAYDPDLGRWLNRDPLKDAEISQGSNPYAYVANNPANYVDPSGLKCILSSVPMHSFNYGISQLVYVQGDDGQCPKCPYKEGDILEFSVNNLMQLMPRVLVGEDRLKATTGTDIRQGPRRMPDA